MSIHKEDRFFMWGLGAGAELRVRRVPGESGFGAGYTAHFNNPEVNLHRPARTKYLVESLPAGRCVMVEAVVMRSPEGM